MSEQRPWLKNYPKGIPANIDPDAYPTLVAMFEDTFEKYAKKPAFSCMGKTLTYEQVDKLSKDFGAYLHSKCIKPIRHGSQIRQISRKCTVCSQDE